MAIVFPSTWFTPDYAALKSALLLAKDLNITKLKILGDSQLIIDQLNGLFVSEDPILSGLYQEVSKTADPFSQLKIA